MCTYSIGFQGIALQVSPSHVKVTDFARLPLIPPFAISSQTMVHVVTEPNKSLQMSYFEGLNITACLCEYQAVTFNGKSRHGRTKFLWVTLCNSDGKCKRMDHEIIEPSPMLCYNRTWACLGIVANFKWLTSHVYNFYYIPLINFSLVPS